MYKSFTALFMAFILVFVAVPTEAVVEAAKEEQSVYINGSKVKYAQAPVAINGTTMVSARETIEGLGLRFSWDKANKRMIGTNGEMTVSLVLGQSTATVNGVSVFLNSPAVERNGRIMIPLRFLTDGLGASMETKGSRINIKLNSKGSSKYNTGLPLQITNTTVTNLSKSTITINYVTFIYDAEWNAFTVSHSMSVGAGKKGVFEYSTVKTGDWIDVDYEDHIFLGRVIESIESGGKITVSKGYASAEKAYLSESFSSDLVNMYQKRFDDFKKQLRQELANNKNTPLKIEGSSITYDVLDDPEANIMVRNLTDKRIVSFELSFSCYDSFGDPVNYLFGSSNRFEGVVRTTDLGTGEADIFVWSLSMYELTSKITNIRIDKVAYSDGTVWRR